MTKREPDQIYRTVEKAVKSGAENSFTGSAKELYALLSGKKVSETVESAYDIFSFAFKRETLESLLLAGVTPKEIESTIGVEAVVVDAYRILFFDPSVFENTLDRLQYAGDYTKSEYGQEMKKLAVNLGKEVLKARLSQGEYVIPASEAKGAIRTTAFMMSQLAKTNPINADVSKEAQRWAQICLKASVDEAEAQLSDAADLRITLEKHTVSVNEETSGIPADEILH